MNRERGAVVDRGPRSALPPTPELRRRLERSPLLLALDIDGTLAAIAPTPGAAFVPADTQSVLSTLTSRPGVHVAFVTGRAALDGRRLLAVRNSWVIGNHGMELLDPAGGLRVNPAVEPYGDSIARAHAALGARLGDIPGVILENKRWTLSTHYRLAARAALPHIERAVREIAEHGALVVTQGKEMYEVRPAIDVNKGTAVIDLANSLDIAAGDPPLGTVFYAGDDNTDEDAFHLLRRAGLEAVTVHVGRPATEGGVKTSAEFLVADTMAIASLLDWVASLR